MYRRSLKMEDNTANSVNFFTRVVDLPVVRQLVTSATEKYNKAKDGNSFVKRTLDAAEETASRAVEYAKPVVTKLESQIALADALACKTLDKVEETLPIVKKTPEEITADAKKIYNDLVVQPVSRTYANVKDYSLGKVSAVKDSSLEKATQLLETKYGAKLVVAVDQFLSQADTLIDVYLPSSDDKDKSEESSMTDANALQKVVVISDKLNKRVIALGYAKVATSKKFVGDVLTAVNASPVVVYARSSVERTSDLVKEQYSQAQLKMLGFVDGVRENVDTYLKVLPSQSDITARLQALYEKLPPVLVYLPNRAQPVLLLASSYVSTLAKTLAEVQLVDLQNRRRSSSERGYESDKTGGSGHASSSEEDSVELVVKSR